MLGGLEVVDTHFVTCHFFHWTPFSVGTLETFSAAQAGSSGAPGQRKPPQWAQVGLEMRPSVRARTAVPGASSHHTQPREASGR